MHRPRPPAREEVADLVGQVEVAATSTSGPLVRPPRPRTGRDLSTIGWSFA